jgi:hypothetical protein
MRLRDTRTYMIFASISYLFISICLSICLSVFLCPQGMPPYSSVLSTEVLSNHTRSASFNDVRHASDEGGECVCVWRWWGDVHYLFILSSLLFSCSLHAASSSFSPLFSNYFVPVFMKCLYTVFKQGFLIVKTGLFGGKKR